MFHFELVHVPGTHHGPDGLSRRRPQPGDVPEPEDDFEDWIDNVNGFIHMINPRPKHLPTLTDTPPVTTFVTEVNREESTEPPQVTTDTENSSSYDIVPRSDAAIKADDKLLKIRPWLETLQRPDGLSDTEYKTFMWYCTDFFVAENRLWRKDPKGHKVVILKHRWLFLMSTAHNDTGHGFYATNALISERYWWPHMSQ